MSKKVTSKRPKSKEWSVDIDIGQRKEKSEIASLKARLNEALAALEQCRIERDAAVGVDDARQQVTPVIQREKSNALREATAVALASDWHIEETVEQAQVNGVNSYNLPIAESRVHRYFSGLNYLLRYHQDHFKINELILWLGGDLITGYLREENLEHNQLSPVQAVAVLQSWIADGVRALLAESTLDKIKIVCSSGNHGRLTEKVRPATREANSIEWLLYHMLQREFANEPRIEFTLPRGSQTYVQVYDWWLRFTHGDEAKFGGGVGGIMIPLQKAIARWNTVRQAHWTNVGHFHTYLDTNDLVVNGSLIGYNAYALSIGAKFEVPRQAFYLVDSKRGKCMSSDIWLADDTENELWQ